MQELGATNASIRHMQRCIYLLQLAAPPLHPEITATLDKLGVIYQEASATPLALRTFWEASNRAVAGGQASLFASIATHMASSYAAVGLFREALQWQRKAAAVWSEAEGGEEGHLSKAAAAAVSLFAQRAVDLELAQREGGPGLAGALAQHLPLEGAAPRRK